MNYFYTVKIGCVSAASVFLSVWIRNHSCFRFQCFFPQVNSSHGQMYITQQLMLFKVRNKTSFRSGQLKILFVLRNMMVSFPKTLHHY